MIRLREIRKVFNSGRPSEFTALRGISIDVELKKVTVLKGPSGSGKTTLLSIIGCMARPTSGRIWFEEREITSLPERFLTEIRRKTFGFVFQQFNLIKGISVIENVMLPSYPCGEDIREIRKKALELIQFFNLSGKESSKIEWLSGGEQQRAAIARALINDPSIIIADEPTAHLDTKLSLEFMGFMKMLKEREKTIIIASHDPIVYESDIVDNVLNMRDGIVITGDL